MKYVLSKRMSSKQLSSFFCGTDMLKVSKSHQIGPSLNVRMTSAFEVLPKAALRRAPQQQWKATSRYALVETAHEI